jgi:hypothetical protein
VIYTTKYLVKRKITLPFACQSKTQPRTHHHITGSVSFSTMLHS